MGRSFDFESENRAEPGKSFEPSNTSRALMLKLGDTIKDLAFAQAEEFIGAGQSTREAGSIVAVLLVEAAWMVAASGALADGQTPDADRFRGMVEEVFTRFRFKRADEVSA